MLTEIRSFVIAARTRPNFAVEAAALGFSLIPISAYALPMGGSNYSLVAVGSLWAFLSLAPKGSVTKAFLLSLLAGAVTLFILYQFTLAPEAPSRVLLIFAGMGALGGFSAAVSMDAPHLPTKQTYKEWLEISLVIGLGLGFLMLPFSSFTDASTAASHVTFGASLIGFTLFLAVRVGALVGRPTRKLLQRLNTFPPVTAKPVQHVGQSWHPAA